MQSILRTKNLFVACIQSIFDSEHAELVLALRDGEECWLLHIYGVHQFVNVFRMYVEINKHKY